MKNKLIAILMTTAALVSASLYLVACGKADGNGTGGITLTIKGSAN